MLLMFYIGICPGTRPYDTSVVDYTSVGVANSALVGGLSLQSGSTYYASLLARDAVGLSSILVSRTITIDTSPPVVTGVRLEYVDQFQTRLRLEWDLIRDTESGIGDLEWGLGTRPFSSDVSGWNRFTWNEGTDLSLPVQGLPLYEGQLLFVSVKVSYLVRKNFISTVIPPVETAPRFVTAPQIVTTPRPNLNVNIT